MDRRLEPTFSPERWPAGWVVRESFTGTKAVNLIIDTGCALDGVLEPKLFRRALQQQGIAWTNQFKYPTGLVRDTVRFHEVVFGGERYANFFIDKSPAITYKRRSYYLNAIGLPFFARHLVTFDFPDRTMYLKRRDIADRHKPVGMNGGLPNQAMHRMPAPPAQLPIRAPLERAVIGE